jgi:hypothetical protein
MTEGRGFSNANAKAKRETRELRYPSWRQGFKEGGVIPAERTPADLASRRPGK